MSMLLIRRDNSGCQCLFGVHCICGINAGTEAFHPQLCLATHYKAKSNPSVRNGGTCGSVSGV